MIIEEVVFQTIALNELKVFYVQTLGLELAKESKHSFTVNVGESSLTFVQSDDNADKPFYHFAININEAQFKRAKEYLSQRVSLLQEESQDEFDSRIGMLMLFIFMTLPGTSLNTLPATT